MNFPGETRADRRKLNQQMGQIPLRQRFTGWALWPEVQVFLGILLGTVLDYPLCVLVSEVLVKLRLIAFDNFNQDAWVPEVIAWSVFLFLLVCFIGLKRLSCLCYFATTALIIHCLVGGLFTLLFATLFATSGDLTIH